MDVRLISKFRSVFGQLNLRTADRFHRAFVRAAKATVPVLLDQCADEARVTEFHSVTRRILRAFGMVASLAVPGFVRSLSEGPEFMRELALFLISEPFDAHREATENFVPKLVALMRGDALTRKYAGKVLRRLGPLAVNAVPDLVELLADPERAADVASVLAGIGSPAVDAAPRLAELLASPKPNVRQEAFFALRSIGPGISVAVPVFRKLLQDRPADLEAYHVLKLLWQLGSAASSAIPVVCPLLRDPGGDWACWAGSALVRMSDPDAVWHRL